MASDREVEAAAKVIDPGAFLDPIQGAEELQCRRRTEARQLARRTLEAAGLPRLRAENERLAADNAKLREALAPLAEWATLYESAEYEVLTDRYSLQSVRGRVTLGDLRRARAALKHRNCDTDQR